MFQDFEKIQKADALARRILSYSRNTLFMNLRFMENALSRLVFVPYDGMVATDMCRLYYDSTFVLKSFQQNDKNITRRYLHMIMHCIFRHAFISPSVERRDIWNLSCDIAVEHMIQELNLKCIDRSMEAKQWEILGNLKSNLKHMTAEKIYQYYIDKNISKKQYESLHKAFLLDDHEPWYPPLGKSDSSGEDGDSDSHENIGDHSTSQNNDLSDSTQFMFAMSHEEAKQVWGNISQQIQTDLETFGKQQGIGGGSLMQNLKAVNRERYDYAEFLRKFAVMGEVMQIDSDAFDYNFYTYGLSLYGNMPLIEPLEYKEVKRIREFVIAIDTSGSVSGELVQTFVTKTYNILKQQESFFSKVNIHIIQCDAEIQEDVKITSWEEFDQYLQTMKLHGFGGTDFRPVFSYVDELIQKKVFINLKGLIYFTDGCGEFPPKQPGYHTAFVFVDDDYNNYEVPVWAIKLILQSNEIMEKNGI